jgi:signal peptidase I
VFSFKPQYAKDAEQLIQYSHKLLNYRRDILPAAKLEEIEVLSQELKDAVKRKDKERAEELNKRFNDLLERSGPPRHELGWRDNVETIVISLIIAAGVRAYILQPFKIPTGSMQPTLNGIIVRPTEKPAPNFLVGTADLALFGRTYVEAKSAEADRIANIQPIKMGVAPFRNFKFFEGTRISTVRGQVFDVPAPPNPLVEAFRLHIGMSIPAGEPFIRGVSTIGDHVFVDKVTYNFRKPKRDDVFVFMTKDIKMIEERGGAGQFYIKRLVGLPGDKLRVEPPRLLINGALPELPGIKRVIAAQNGYNGYTNPSSSRGQIEANSLEAAAGNSMIWVNEGYEHVVGKGNYYAMGDNSANSWDSRNWGEVPGRNAVGRGVFVWWPFGPHWGFVR